MVDAGKIARTALHSIVINLSTESVTSTTQSKSVKVFGRNVGAKYRLETKEII
jgi:hypothetical protein